MTSLGLDKINLHGTTEPARAFEHALAVPLSISDGRGVGAFVLFGLLGTAIVAITFLPAPTVTVLRLTERR